jgi:hypothetical protein
MFCYRSRPTASEPDPLCATQSIQNAVPGGRVVAHSELSTGFELVSVRLAWAGQDVKERDGGAVG